MRIRNIFTGRCGHRPLRTTTEKRRILKGGQSRPPLQPVLENRVWVEKSPRFPFRPPPKKREHPAQGRMGTTDEARGGAFRVMSSGLSA